MQTDPPIEALPEGFEVLKDPDNSDPATAEIRAALPSVLPGLRHLFALYPEPQAKATKRPAARRPRPKGPAHE